MILTVEEIDNIAEVTGEREGAHTFAVALETKLLEKLCAGVEMPEPVGYLDGQGDSYTADQLRTVAAAARVKALEDAAVVCESTCWSADIDTWRDMTKIDVATKSMLACAEKIRALKGAACPTPSTDTGLTATTRQHFVHWITEMTNHEDFLFPAFVFCASIVAAFSFGHMFGRDSMCNDMGADYYKGKCVVVERKEVKL